MVQSTYGQPEVEAELPNGNSCPTITITAANATFKVLLKKVLEGSRPPPQLIVSKRRRVW
jgi:N utilization substance protein A